MDALLIFRAANVAKSVAAYFGFIESVSSDVKKLLHQSFKSGVENLRYAENAIGENQKHYLRKAQDDFISSFSLERDENLISAHIGAAMCQYLLEDIAKQTINKIQEIKLSSQEIAVAVTKDILLGTPIYLMGYRFRIFESSRINKFEEYKRLALTAKNIN